MTDKKLEWLAQSGFNRISKTLFDTFLIYYTIQILLCCLRLLLLQHSVYKNRKEIMLQGKHMWGRVRFKIFIICSTAESRPLLKHEILPLKWHLIIY